MSVLDNVAIAVLAGTGDRRTARDDAATIIETVGLGAWRDSPTEGLPTAALKRLELARTLALRPKVLLLDEVLAGLVPAERAPVLELLERLRTDEGVTLVFVEHIMAAVMRLSDSVLVLHLGKVLTTGRPDEVTKDPRVIEAYLGRSRPVLTLEKVTAGYHRLQILHEISIAVNDGEIVSIVGANGAGKTTTLNTIAGLVKPTSGSITFDGKPAGGRRPSDLVDAGLVLVPEGRALFGTLTVEENLRMGGWSRDRAELSSSWTRCSSCFRFFANGVPRSPRRSVAASSRCWPSGARSWPSRSCSCWTSRPRASRPS